MSVLVRVLKSPAWVAFWTIWEEPGDAAYIRVEPSAERMFTLTKGTVRASVRAGQDSPFADYLADAPRWTRDRFVDFSSTVVFPIMAGEWVAECLSPGGAEGWCHVPLELEQLTAVLTSRAAAEQLLDDSVSGPYLVHYDFVQEGRAHPTEIGEVVEGRRVIDAQMLLDSAYNDLSDAVLARRQP